MVKLTDIFDKNKRLILGLGLCTLGSLLAHPLYSPTAQHAEAQVTDDEPEVVETFMETQENNGVHGDCIVVVYNQEMLIEAQPHPLAGGMQDANNVPGSELEAPAEYPHHQGNATAKKTARNYKIKITPGPYSRTQPFEGSWRDLGGEAVYHPSDSGRRTVLLKLPSKATHVFEPGDRIEVTVANTVKGPNGKKIKTGKNKRRGQAS